MVQILPQFDPGREVGQSIGSGLGDALKLLGERQLGLRGLQALQDLDLSQLSEKDIMAEVAKATLGLPHLQKQASVFTDQLIRQKRVQALREAQSRAARGREGMTPVVPTPQRDEAIPAAGDAMAAEQVVEQAPMQPEAPAQRRATEAEGDELAAGGMRDVPLLQETTGAEPLLSQREILQITEPFVLSGDMQGMQQALSDARDQKLKQRELRIQAQQAKTAELTRRRELEKEIARDVLGRADQLLREKGLEGGEMWNRLAYNYFDSERRKAANRDIPDEKLWQAAGRKLERKIEDIAGAGAKLHRPTFRADRASRAKTAQKWAQKHLETYGNNVEERNLLKTVFMDDGWSREEASTLVQPMNVSLEKRLAKLPKIPPMKLPGPGQQNLQEQEARSVRFRKFADKALPILRENFQSGDSILVLKNKLVREKGLTDEEARALINEMEQDGVVLQDHQGAELPFTNEATIPSLYDLFLGRDVKEILGPLIQ